MPNQSITVIAKEDLHQHQREDASLFASFPLWHLVSDFLVLSEVLTARLVCRQWNEGLCQGVSLKQSIRFLDQALRLRNMTVLHDTSQQQQQQQQQQQSWSTVLNTVPQTDRLRAILHPKQDGDEPPPPFRILLKTLRVMQFVPEQMAISYNAKYGRHCLGMTWNADTQQSEPILFEPCTRKDCSTCHVQLPMLLSTSPQKQQPKEETATTTTTTTFPLNHNNAEGEGEVSTRTVNNQDNNMDYNIHDFIQLVLYQETNNNNKKESQHQQNQQPEPFIDLSSFTNQCIPNLPPDLVCPVCQNADQRTLLLSGFSYQSHTGGSGGGDDELSPLGYRTCNLLTITPLSSSHGQDNNSDQDDITTTTTKSIKRQRTEEGSVVDRNDHSFPPWSYQDLAMPDTTTTTTNRSTTSAASSSLQPKPYLKHITSIHCVSCQQFAVLAPAGMCWSSRFPCLSRSRKLHDTKTSTTYVGGMLVRTGCSEPNCIRPVFCHECSHAAWHMPYPYHDDADTNNNDPEALLLRSCVGVGTSMLQMQHSSRCDSCNVDYCPAHAWLSTVCHHW